MVEGTAGGTGREFFRSLVRHLAEAIDVHYAAVSEFMAPTLGHVLASWDRDRVVEVLDFDFTTSPAGHVLSSDLVHFPTGVLRRFPHAMRLVERDAEGYMAVPVVGSQGHLSWTGLVGVRTSCAMPARMPRNSSARFTSVNVGVSPIMFNSICRPIPLAIQGILLGLSKIVR